MVCGDEVSSLTLANRLGIVISARFGTAPAFTLESHIMDELIIESGRANLHYWKDLWKFRELFYLLSWRDILVRYKQTVVGVAWALLRPFITMVLFTVIFEQIGRIPSPKGVPYPVLMYCAMLPWQLFSSALSDSGTSIIANGNLISKIYFPRLIVPAVPVIVGLIDFLIAMVFLVLLLAWFQFAPDWRIIALPFFIFLALIASLGAAFLFSALTVKYRDFRFVAPFIVQFGMYASPVVYSSSNLYDKYPQWSLLYAMNPMVSVIDGFRWSLLRGAEPIHIPEFCISLGMLGVLLMIGVWYFRQTERSFADII